MVVIKILKRLWKDRWIFWSLPYKLHTEARRMLSHNRRWIYIYHIEEDFVIVDRICVRLF